MRRNQLCKPRYADPFLDFIENLFDDDDEKMWKDVSFKVRERAVLDAPVLRSLDKPTQLNPLARVSCSLQVRGDQVRAHRAIIAARCPYMMARWVSQPAPDSGRRAPLSWHVASRSAALL